MKNHKEHTETPFDFLDDNFNVVDFYKITPEISIEGLDKISELSKTAMKLLKYIRMMSFRDEKIIYFDIKESKKFCEFKQDKSVYNALSELINKEILAGRKNHSEFYYNPKYINHEKESLW